MRLAVITQNTITWLGDGETTAKVKMSTDTSPRLGFLNIKKRTKKRQPKIFRINFLLFASSRMSNLTETAAIIEKFELLFSWSKCAIVESDHLQCTIIEPEVVQGKQYYFRVAAENAAGLGKPSLPTQLIIVEDPLGKLGLQQ